MWGKRDVLAKGYAPTINWSERILYCEAIIELISIQNDLQPVDYPFFE